MPAKAWTSNTARMTDAGPTLDNILPCRGWFKAEEITCPNDPAMCGVYGYDLNATDWIRSPLTSNQTFLILPVIWKDQQWNIDQKPAVRASRLGGRIIILYFDIHYTALSYHLIHRDSNCLIKQNNRISQISLPDSGGWYFSYIPIRCICLI